MTRILFLMTLLALTSGCKLMPVSSAPAADIRDTVVNEALAQQDRPYRYQGNDPSGFDDGGFAQYVYGRAGIVIPQTAGAQEDVGNKIDFFKMKPGDLIFYNIEDKDRQDLHVGIYLGNGRMMHVPKNGKVQTDEINAPYWQRRYVDSMDLIP